MIHSPSDRYLTDSHPHLLRLVDVVDQVLDHGSGVVGLDGFGVMGDNNAGDGSDDDDTVLALRLSADTAQRNRRAARQTFLPYRLRSSARIAKNLSPPTTKPFSRTCEGLPKAEASAVTSDWGICRLSTSSTRALWPDAIIPRSRTRRPRRRKSRGSGWRPCRTGRSPSS